uniref:Uncharacterized protein n=1 Tax=Glycine max TaxID=3847 RepID=I1NH56_SOYBN
MPESETGTPTAASVPATPDTPGGPLFTSLRVDSLSHERDSFAMARCKCLPTKGHICFTDFSVGVPLPNVSLTQKVGAEFVGTFILIFAATAGPIVNNKYNGVETLMGNAACAGLTVMFIILSIGHISGAHLNPSLTIAFAAFRHFPWAHVPAYIAAQVSASICACYALKGVGELAGIAVGATVLLNILISGPTSGGSMNPVRTLGPAVAAGNYKHIWIYLVAPTLGALAGAGVYTLVKLRDNEAEPPRQVRSFRR